jgi:hypothetical protein
MTALIASLALALAWSSGWGGRSAAEAEPLPAADIFDTTAREAVAGLTPAEREDDLAAVRALRRFLYRRMPFASSQEAWITDDPIRNTVSLTAGVDLLYQRGQGVWCQAAAILLSRLYKDAGYRVWLTSFGDVGSMTHTVVLVQAAGQIYLEDPYFNMDYVRDDGAPLPYFQLLEQLAARHTPRARQDLDARLGVFDYRQVAKEWTPALLQGEIACTHEAAPYVCSVVMTKARFAETYFHRADVAAFLSREGWPEQWDYLMLFPLWTSGDGFRPIQARAEAIAAKAARAASGRKPPPAGD